MKLSCRDARHSLVVLADKQERNNGMRIANVAHAVVISKQPRRCLFVGGAGVAELFRLCFCVAAAEPSISSICV